MTHVAQADIVTGALIVTGVVIFLAPVMVFLVMHD